MTPKPNRKYLVRWLPAHNWVTMLCTEVWEHSAYFVADGLSCLLPDDRWDDELKEVDCE